MSLAKAGDDFLIKWIGGIFEILSRRSVPTWKKITNELTREQTSQLLYSEVALVLRLPIVHVSDSSLRAYIVNRIIQIHRDREKFWDTVAERLSKELNRQLSQDDEPPKPVPLNVGLGPDAAERVVAGVIDLEYYLDHIREDIRLLPSGLVVKEPSMFERWNRLSAEAEFRQQVSLPITILANIVAFRVVLLPPHNLLLGLTISVVSALLLLTLDRMSSSRAREAGLQLLEALDLRLVDSAVLQEIRSGIVRFERRFSDRSWDPESGSWNYNRRIYRDDDVMNRDDLAARRDAGGGPEVDDPRFNSDGPAD
jgi:hypothetical protein